MVRKKLTIFVAGWALAACSVSPDEEKTVSQDRKLSVKDSTILETSDATGTEASQTSEEKKSFELFKSTVYPVTQKCSACHNVTAPKFASDDPLDAFIELTDADKVNFSDPASSRLVLRLSEDQHNCWSDCEENAQTMLAAVEQWANALNGTQGDAVFNVMTAAFNFTEAVAQANVNPLQKGIIAYEIEEATLKAPFESNDEDGTAVAVSKTGGGVATTAEEATANAALGSITINFNADETWNAWAIYVRVQAPDDAQNTTFYQIDDQPMEQWDIPPTGGNYAYRRLGGANGYFDLARGAHTLKFVQGEDNIRFDKIVITRVNIIDVNTVQTTSLKATTFYWDLSDKLDGRDVGIAFTIADFDPTAFVMGPAYLVNNSGDTIKLSGIYPIINGKYLPNHSAFSKVKVESADAVVEVATNSSTILKDDPDTDKNKIGLGFDELSVVE